MKKLLRSLVLASVIAAAPAQTAVLRSGMGGDAGYGELALGRNDDLSSNLLTSPFSFDFFGQTYNSFYVNNNGNISFGSPLGSFTPTQFNGHSSMPIIAPFWADVDTSCISCGEVYIGSQGSNSFTVTWNNVGFFAANSTRTNNFQMTLTNAGDNNFDIEFLYDRLEWSTGRASGGNEIGLGGIPAQAGFDSGNGSFFTLPGSFLSPGVLNLANQTNVVNGDPGEWRLEIRNGTLAGNDGLTPITPLLPDGGDATNGYTFDFNVDLTDSTATTRTYWIDPEVATGYDYIVTALDSGTAPTITSASFLDLGDADGYEIFSLTDLVNPLATGVGVAGMLTYDFGAAGIAGFAVRGIDTSLGLDPNNVSAFVTGLNFNFDGATGNFNVRQLPITTEISAAPEPATWAMMILGFGMIGAALRRRRAASGKVHAPAFA